MIIHDLYIELTQWLRAGQEKIRNYKKISECHDNGPLAEVHFTEIAGENIINETAIKCTRCNHGIAYSTTVINPKDETQVFNHITNLVNHATCPLLEQ